MRSNPGICGIVVLTGCIGLTIGAAQAGAQIGETGFDVDASGNAIPSGHRLTYEFAAVGMTLTAVNATSGTCTGVFASDQGRSGFGSEPNVITLCPETSAADISENVFGLIRASFLTPVREVCIAVEPVSDGRGVLRAYDAARNLLIEELSRAGETMDLCVAAERIRSVEFSGYQSEYVWFDDLRVDFGGSGGVMTRYVPGIANVGGAGGTRWSSDLEITNAGSSAMECRIELLPWGQSNQDPTWRSFPIGPGESVRFENVMDSLFETEGAATLRVIGVGGSVSASARTFNNDPAGTFGQFITGVASSQAVSPGRRGVLNLVQQSPQSDEGFRTNLGLVNMTGTEITVEIDVFDQAGLPVGTDSRRLAPYESVQIDRVLRVIAGGAVTDAHVEVWSSTPGALFTAYASLVDNRSGDPTYIPTTIH